MNAGFFPRTGSRNKNVKIPQRGEKMRKCNLSMLIIHSVFCWAILPFIADAAVSAQPSNSESSLPLTGIVHLQDIGDRTFRDGQWAGTKGELRRLEGFSVNFLSPATGIGIEYMCHVQDVGNQSWMPGGQYCGTRGRSLRLEGFAVRLTGNSAGDYDVFYGCHVEGIGDTGPYKNGDFCGTRGQSKRVEAIIVWISPKRVFEKPFPKVESLKLWQQTATGDSYTGTASIRNLSSSVSATFNLPASATYSFARVDGFVYKNHEPGTKPLKVYYHASKKMFLTIADEQSIQAAEKKGFVFLVNAGWVYPISNSEFSAPPGTVPVKLFCNPINEKCITATAAKGVTNFQFVRNEAYIFNATPPNASFSDFDPNILLKGVSTRLILHGQNLYPYRFQEMHLIGTSVAGLPGVTIEKIDFGGRWVELFISPQAWAGKQSGIFPPIGINVLKRQLSETQYQYALISPDIPMLDHLGEQKTRNHPRVTEQNGWKWNRFVGPSVNFEQITSDSATAVIQTFTGKKWECTTELAEAHKPFRGQNKVVTRNDDGAKLLELVTMRPGPDLGNTLRHRAKFTNLKIGRYYKYRVQCTKDSEKFIGTAESTFRASAPSDHETKIIAWADYIKCGQPYDKDDSNCGYGDGTEPSARWKEKAKQQSYHVKMLENFAEKNLVDIGIESGDVIDEDALRRYAGTTTNCGLGGGNTFGYLTRYHSMLENVEAGIALFPTFGNHDVLNDCGIDHRPGTTNKADDFFLMMATPHARNEFPKNQWFSFEWGNTHLNALDLVVEEGQKKMSDTASECGYSSFEPGSEQRKWFKRDVNEISPKDKWHLVYHHGQPRSNDGKAENPDSPWDPRGACGTWGIYKDYCKMLNDSNIDLLFTGHSGNGLRRHLSEGASGDDFIFSLRNTMGATHIRLRDDAVILSRVWPGKDGQYTATENGKPGIGSLFECYKYIPGVKAGCDTSNCEIKDYSLQRLITDSCETVEFDLNKVVDLKNLKIPCCNKVDPADPGKCYSSANERVDRVVNIRVLSCNRAAIADGCLKRQLIPVVIDDNGSPFITNDRLLQECTPCVKVDNAISGLADSDTTYKCGTQYEKK